MSFHTKSPDMVVGSDVVNDFIAFMDIHIIVAETAHTTTNSKFNL